MRKFDSLPDFSYEKKFWQAGYRWIIGVDEVGRGALAGPVVAGATTLKTTIIGSRPRRNNCSNVEINDNDNLKYILNLGIDDSKKLSPQKRLLLEKEIKKYFYWAVGEGSVAEINRLGIVRATERAMRRAIKRVIKQLAIKQLRVLKKAGKVDPQITQLPNCYLLSDAFHIKYLKGIGLKNQQAIVKGDQNSITIAAASIIAKVYRDNLMRKLAVQYGIYGWEKNKGYGTEFHRQKILKNGSTKLHRQEFVRFVSRFTKYP